MGGWQETKKATPEQRIHVPKDSGTDYSVELSAFQNPV
jgi:hypothetical protein